MPLTSLTQLTQSTEFTQHTEATAPDAARGTLTATAAKFGFVPSPVARLAESPETLQAFLRASALFESATLGPIEREVVVMTIATRHECHYCVAMHTATLHRLGAGDELVGALRAEAPPSDDRLAALRRFVIAVLDRHGAATDDDLTAFFDAGFTRRNALEVVLGVGTYTLSTFANRLTRAPLDEAFAEHAWPGAAA
jgi:uncharacterized peroxidase-related enzyme